jgi:hypothetical protein
MVVRGMGEVKKLHDYILSIHIFESGNLRITKDNTINGLWGRIP